MKRVWKANQVILGWEGKPIKINKSDNPFDDEDTDYNLGDLTTFDAMLVIVNQMSVETLDDSSKKKAVKQALKAATPKGKIGLEAEGYKWLKAAAEKVCPKAWQDNANEVYDIITEGYVKENEPSKATSKSKPKAKVPKEKDEAETEEDGEPSGD